jgi:endonuclease/exonuclease/phosphatase family metal-dependent hydrolase
MRIATYNVENLDLPVDARVGVLRPALERMQADILCLQEVNGQHIAGQQERTLAALDALVAGTPYASYARASSHPPGRQGAADIHNLVTLSRYPIIASRQVLHDLVPPLQARMVTARPPQDSPQPIRFERPLLVTEIEAGGRRLTVINVHLRAPLASAIPGGKRSAFTWESVGAWAEGYTLSGFKRSGQALELRLLVESMFDADPGAMVLLAGDFNAEERETPLRTLIGAPEDTGNSALAARTLVPLARAIDPDRRFSVVHHGREQLVDHMLASQALFGLFRDIEIHNEALGDEAIGYAKGVTPAGSYHAPLVAEFAL